QSGRGVLTMKKTIGVVAVLALVSCKSLDAPDFKATSLGDLTNNPTATVVATALQGLPLVTRDQAVGSSYAGLVVSFGEIGREGFGLDPANPDQQSRRLVSETRSLGQEVWRVGYQALSQAVLCQHAVDALADWSAPQKEAARGWIKTFMAYNLLIII